MDTAKIDLLERVTLFNTMKLPGQPFGMHMGTSYLVNDLAREVLDLRAKVAAADAMVDVAKDAVAGVQAWINGDISTQEMEAVMAAFDATITVYRSAGEGK